MKLFLNRLTADDKNYLLNKDNLTLPIQMQLSHKQKSFSNFFFAFSKSILHFKHLPNKEYPHSSCISGDKCLKSRVSEDASTDNLGNASKLCCNLNDSTFSIFINHCEGNYIGKSLF